MLKLKIAIGDYVVYARCHTDKIPKTINAIREGLPTTGYLRHAKICDNEWMIPLPFGIDVDEKENRVRPNPGDIGYNRMRQFFCGWYSDMQPLGFTNLVATIDKEDLPEYGLQMSKCWENPGAEVCMEIVEVEDV